MSGLWQPDLNLLLERHIDRLFRLLILKSRLEEEVMLRVEEMRRMDILLNNLIGVCSYQHIVKAHYT